MINLSFSWESRAVSESVYPGHLFDLSQHDARLPWLYQAQYHARRLHQVLDPAQVGELFDPAFALKSAHRAFRALAGPTSNEYAGCSPARWLGTSGRVRADNQEAPILRLSTLAWPCAPPLNGRLRSRKSTRA